MPFRVIRASITYSDSAVPPPAEAGILRLSVPASRIVRPKRSICCERNWTASGFGESR
jgi:hypothetical protein